MLISKKRDEELKETISHKKERKMVEDLKNNRKQMKKREKMQEDHLEEKDLR